MIKYDDSDLTQRNYFGWEFPVFYDDITFLHMFALCKKNISLPGADLANYRDQKSCGETAENTCISIHHVLFCLCFLTYDKKHR